MVMSVRCCNWLVLCGVLLVILISQVSAQNYHYSNGWHPGKRSRLLVSSYFRPSAPAQDAMCSFQPTVLSTINSIVQEELLRILKTCVPENSMQTLKEAVEQMRAARDTPDKLTEEDSKW